MLTKIKAVALVVVCVGVVASAIVGGPVHAASPAQGGAPGDAQRGAYVFQLSGGCDCHSDVFARSIGGQTFAGPFGTVYSKNITPDPDSGIGSATDAQIIDAIRLGKSQLGKQLSTIMPYTAFSGISDQDMADLVAYLKSTTPVLHDIPFTQLKSPVAPFTPAAAAPKVAPASGTERGGYLVNALSFCVNCHTPRNQDGTIDMSKLLSGSPQGFPPNITPDPSTNVGKWTTAQIATLLRTGQRPNGTLARTLMFNVIKEGFQHMTQDDALAIADYLKTVPPIKSAPAP
jgi:mono/diheme cytochrome c family protein